MAEKLTDRPSIEDCQHELKRYILAFSIMLSDIYGESNVVALLQGDPKTNNLWNVLANADLSDRRFVKLLPDAYAFAIHGQVSDIMELQAYIFPTYFDTLSSFLKMCSDNEWFDSVVNEPSIIEVEVKCGSIRHVVDIGLARSKLDQGEMLQARDIALLAGISERSVQNAFSAKGANQLKTEKQGGTSYVSAADSIEWLADKKGFVPTKRNHFEPDGPLPAALNSQDELREFLKQRTSKKHATTVEQVFTRFGVSYKDASSKASGSTPIEIADAMLLAEVLDLPPKWLLTQILRINHPTEAGFLL